MGLEFELKYRATPQILDTIRDAFPGPFTPIAMSTTYFDTPGGDLSARHWTVRHRLENEKHICTLKIPAGKLTRGEWELECADIHAAIPVLAEMSRLEELPELTRGGIIPTCGVRFLRQVRLLDLNGCTAELALDQGVLVNGALEAPFAEVELELKSGIREALLAYGPVFADQFGLEVQPKSKFFRARNLKEDGHGI